MNIEQRLKRLEEKVSENLSLNETDKLTRIKIEYQKILEKLYLDSQKAKEFLRTKHLDQIGIWIQDIDLGEIEKIGRAHV